MNRQALSEALAEWHRFDDIYDDWELGRLPVETYREATLVVHDHLHPVADAARLVERLLPGACGTCEGSRSITTIYNQHPQLMPCPFCHGSGRVWDEGIVEAVAATIAECSDPMGEANDAWRDVAVAVLSALVELLTEKVET